MLRAWLLPCVLALQVLRGVLGDHCAPCQQVDCQPPPPNCKYGVTFDRCGCCQVCIQSNGERCRFIPNANGIGFICEWGPVSKASQPMHDLITSQLQHPVGLDAFFRALFDVTKLSNNNRRAELLTFNVLAKNSGHPVKAVEDAEKTKVIDNVEHFKTYPTCGLYDYLTSEVTKGYETITEKSRKRKKMGRNNRDNTRLSNTEGSFLGLDNKLSINEVKAMRKMNEIEHRKDKEVKEKTVGETFKFKPEIRSFIDALKRVSIHPDLEGTRGDSKRSSHLREDTNENVDHQRNDNDAHPDGRTKTKIMQMLQRSDEALNGHAVPHCGHVEFLDSHGGRHEEMSVRDANGYSLTRGRPKGREGVAKSDEAQKMLGETISDIIAMFVNRARAMHVVAQDDAPHGNAETKQSKADPIRLLGYLLKKKQQDRPPLPQSDDRRIADVATDVGDKKFVAEDRDSSLPRRSLNLIDSHHRILPRKNAHNKKDLGDEESLKVDGDFSRNEVDQMLEENLVPDKRERTYGIKREGGQSNTHSFLKMNGPLFVGNEQEEESDNSLLEEPRQELGATDNERDGKKFTSGSYINRLLSGEPQWSLDPRNYHVRQMLKRKPSKRLREFIHSGRWRGERNEAKQTDSGHKLLSRKKRNAPTEKEKRIMMSAEPQSYGTFAISENGNIHVISSEVGKKPFEELLNEKFPGRVITAQETTKAPVMKTTKPPVKKTTKPPVRKQQAVDKGHVRTDHQHKRY